MIDLKHFLKNRIQEKYNMILYYLVPRYMVMRGYYAKDGKPLKCYKCKSSNHIIIDNQFYDGYYLCEYACKCSKCNIQLGYWSYGGWMD